MRIFRMEQQFIKIQNSGMPLEGYLERFYTLSVYFFHSLLIWAEFTNDNYYLETWMKQDVFLEKYFLLKLI